METKPKLYYFHGRGRMESIRWLLAAAGVEFEEEFLETREQYEKLQKDGRLLFDQVPLVEIDGMPLTQSRAILSYLAAKYNLYGKDLKERLRIDMYADGTLDLMLMIAQAPFKPPKEKEESYALVVKRAKTRYFPVFEKILKDHGEDFLVGNQLSWADIQLLEAILMVEELSAPVLSDFPLLQFSKHFYLQQQPLFFHPGSSQMMVSSFSSLDARSPPGHIAAAYAKNPAVATLTYPCSSSSHFSQREPLAFVC